MYGAEPSERSLSLRFAGIIQRAHEQSGQRVAILVDEYDKPMLQAIGNEELQASFDEDIHTLASAQHMTYDEACAELKECYDGYHFVDNSIGIYNPFSLLNAFSKRKFGSYWFETGTPTYLVELLKKHHYNLHRMAHEETDSDTLNSIDSASDNPIPVIYQSGYLTIKGYDRRFGLYRLGFPNREVEEGFIRFLLPLTSTEKPAISNGGL